jgi:hypothetical protein
MGTVLIEVADTSISGLLSASVSDELSARTAVRHGTRRK